MIGAGMLCLAFLAGCQPSDPSTQGNAGEPGQTATTSGDSGVTAELPQITGTINYRERILLRPGSRVEISLEDVSRADTAATKIAGLELSEPGQVPIPFELEYDPADIDSRMSYSVRAKILAADGSLLFTSDTATPVITRGAGQQAELWLVSAARSSAPAGGAAAAENAPGMELKGQFSYLADAALFRDCSTGKRFPVEMSGQFKELERAYSNSGIEAGENLTVNLKGRYLERPGMEENTRTIMLIVDEFHQISDSQNCTPEQHAELLNTYWKLVELGGKPIRTEANQREAHLVLQSAEQRVTGHGGCNSFFGSYRLDGEMLSFTGMGSTMMACISGMETEQAFLLALGETNRALVEGQFLELYEGEHKLARFEAVYF
jgi:uncharacterized lipoprotein YbaY/heat shock protein HslJ